MRAPELGDDGGQDFRPDDVARRHAHCAALVFRLTGCSPRQRGRRRRHQTRMRQQLERCFRRQKTASRPCEQLCAKLCLELLHMPPKCGLREPQLARSTRQAAMISNGEKRAQKRPVDGSLYHAKMYIKNAVFVNLTTLMNMPVFRGQEGNSPMFIGHYAPALVARALPKGPALATGFIAVQLIDVGFFSLSWAGIEKWRPNLTVEGFSPIDLYFMPYTHSLLGTAVWATSAAVAFALFAPAAKRVAGSLIVFALVVSHWLLDLVVHRNDLGLLGDAEPKLGFGLWNWPLIEAPLELGLLAIGLAIYIGATKPKGWLGNITPWIVLLVMLAGQMFNWFGPREAHPDPTAFSAMGLAAYGVAALLGLALDLTRARKA